MSTAEGDEQDLTRKQRRDAARAERKQIEESQAASALRRTRLTQLAIVAAIVIAIVVVIVAATGGGGKKTKIESNANGPIPTEVSSLLNGIPQVANTLGSASAPVTLQYFADLECPVCRQFTEGALKPLIESDVRTGKLKIEYRSLKTATGEPETFKSQQVAALAAGKQNKAWYYIELFYHQQGEENTGYVTESYLEGIAKQVPGMNLSKWSSDRSDATLVSSIETDAQAANNLALTGTPSFSLAKTGSTPKKFEASSYTDPSSYQAEITKLSKH
jgi:protein-disulfide isomerase